MSATHSAFAEDHLPRAPLAHLRIGHATESASEMRCCKDNRRPLLLNHRQASHSLNALITRNGDDETSDAARRCLSALSNSGSK